MKRKVVKIILIIAWIWIAFVTIDFTLSKINQSPIFALPVRVYKDGGTVEYYGLGYKVIKYNVLDYSTNEGRKDTTFGSWNLKYDSRR